MHLYSSNWFHLKEATISTIHRIKPFKNDKPLDIRRPRSELKPAIIWKNAIAICSFHIISTITFFLTIHKMKLMTILWLIAYGIFAGFGITGGVHRLWSHRSYKAKLPLRILLIVCYSAAGMNSIYDWVRDHRVHHKFSETDADPHNSHRGFFFAHVGWLMERKHSEVLRKGKTIDMSDIENDPLIRFHTKYFVLFKIWFCFVLPILIPVYVWNETWLYSFCSQAMIRYMWILNVTWAVNSFAHIWGMRPYNKGIRPVENRGVSFAALGEGWHNYHHVFPWDYKAAELGSYGLNWTTMFLDFFRSVGQVYEAKSASPQLVEAVMKRCGSGGKICEISEKVSEEIRTYDKRQ